MATSMDTLWSQDRFCFWQTEDKTPKEIDTFLQYLDNDPTRLNEMLQQVRTFCKIDVDENKNEAVHYNHVVRIGGNGLATSQKIAKEIQSALISDQQILVRTSIQQVFAGAYRMELLFGKTTQLALTFIEERQSLYLSSQSPFEGSESALGRIEIVWQATQEKM